MGSHEATTDYSKLCHNVIWIHFTATLYFWKKNVVKRSNSLTLEIMREAGYEQTHLSFVTLHCRVTLSDLSTSCNGSTSALPVWTGRVLLSKEPHSWAISLHEKFQGIPHRQITFLTKVRVVSGDLLPRNRVVTKRCVSFGPLANWVSIKTNFSCPRKK